VHGSAAWMFFPAGSQELRCIGQERHAERREQPKQLRVPVEGRCVASPEGGTRAQKPNLHAHIHPGNLIPSSITDNMLLVSQKKDNTQGYNPPTRTPTVLIYTSNSATWMDEPGSFQPRLTFPSLLSRTRRSHGGHSDARDQQMSPERGCQACAVILNPVI
ncbi:hypothetical protein D4764_05G0008360, partial [Takifugu flavidus]